MPKLKQTANVNDDMAAVIEQLNLVKEEVSFLRKGTVPNQKLLDDIDSLKEAIADLDLRVKAMESKKSSRKAD